MKRRKSKAFTDIRKEVQRNTAEFLIVYVAGRTNNNNVRSKQFILLFTAEHMKRDFAVTLRPGIGTGARVTSRENKGVSG